MTDADRAPNRVAPATALAELLGHVWEWWPDALIVIDPEGRIAHANDVALQLFHYGAGELVGESIERLVPERFHASHVESRVAYGAAPARRRMGTGLALQARRKDGSEFPVDISLAPAEAAGVRFVICTVRDMSSYRKLEDSLRFSESRYRNIVEDASEVFYLVRVDGDPLRGAVLYVSPRAAVMTGYDPGAFVSDTALWSSLIHPEDLSGVGETTQDMARTGGDVVRTYRLRRADGVYRWIEDHVVPLLDEHGRLVGYHGAARDITERHETNLALVEAQERLELAVRTARVGLWDWQLATQAVHYSDAWRAHLGLSNAPPLIATWRERLHPDDRADMDSALQQALREPGGSLTRRYRLRHEDGSYRHILGSVAVLRNDAGHADRLLAAEVDVTEAVETRAHFTHLQGLDTLARFSPAIVHDLRNLLFVVTEGAENARHFAGQASSPELDRSLAALTEAGHDASALVNALLQVSREDGRSEPLQVINLWDVLTDTRGLLAHLVTSRISLEMVCEASDRTVRGHRHEIQHALLNLAANARDAMPDGGRLTIRLRDQADEAGLHLEVADTGTGVAPEIQQRIFEPYFTTKAGSQGTGLGLMAVRAMADRHEARISLESAPGQGTLFRITFPPVTGPPASRSSLA